MVGFASSAVAHDLEVVDELRILRPVPWSRFEAELARRGDTASRRISYLEGALELMRPSKDHERIKSFLARLVEAYALEVGVDLSPYGSWTLKSLATASGAEPDECYLFGDQEKPVPDLVIEVVWASGGIDKLEIYRRLEIGEVWFWKAGRLEVHLLRDGRYELSPRSALLPGLDLELVVSLLDRPTALQAVRALRQALKP